MRACAIVAMLAIVCVLAVNQAEAGCSDEWHQSVMSRMDEWRASEGVGSLGCDESLAAGAQDYANGCPDGHAGGYIENMAWNSHPISGVDAWGGERNAYHASPEWSMQNGHYYNMVNNNNAGCGWNPDCGSWGLLVCRYN